jgi:hypothetical protein
VRSGSDYAVIIASGMSDPPQQEPIRNPPAYVAIAIAGIAVIALAGLFKADWDIEVSFFTALVAGVVAILVAVVAIGWSVAKRGRGWLAATAALLLSIGALGWVAWTFVLLLRASA